jgi:hypothetical protein
MSKCSGKGCSSGPCRKGESKRVDVDVKALGKALQWIETSSSGRMKRATAEFIYDRYARHPSAAQGGTDGGGKHE